MALLSEQEKRQWRESKQPLLDLFAQKGWTFKQTDRAGRQFECQQHDSLTIYKKAGETTWKFKHFAQAETGDVFEAAKVYFDCNGWDEQVAFVCGKQELPPPAPSPVAQEPTQGPSEPLVTVARRAAEQLHQDQKAMLYLTQDRKLWQSTVDEYELGLHHWWHGGLHRPIRTISIPLRPPAVTEPTAIRLRLLEDGVTNAKGKPVRYVSVKGSRSSACPLILRMHEKPRYTIIVGGEFKAFRVWQAVCDSKPEAWCDTQVIGLPGEGVWQTDWRSYAMLTPWTVLMPDPDAAGWNLARTLRQDLRRLRVADVPMIDGTPYKIDDALDREYSILNALPKGMYT